MNLSSMQIINKLHYNAHLRSRYQDKTFIDETFIDKWVTTNGSRLGSGLGLGLELGLGLVRIGVRKVGHFLGIDF